MANRRRTKKTPVSVELHENFIKLAEGTFPRRGTCVFRLIKKQFFSKEKTAITREIANLFKANKLHTKKIFLNLPRHLVMSRNLHLPSTSDEEIKNMVKMEAARQMPYRDEDVIAGYKIIAKLKDGYSDVLLAIVQASVVRRLIKILRNANLAVEKIALGSESLFGWYSAVAGAKKKAAACEAVINVDAGYVDVDVVEKDKLVFTRAFSYGGGDSSIGKNVIDEIIKSILTCERERNVNVGEIILTGAENKLRELEPLLEKAFELPLRIKAQTTNIELDKNVPVDLGTESFVELIGLSTKYRDMEINLLPKTMVEDNQLRILRAHFANMLILFCCVILIFFGIAAKKITDKARYLKKLNSEILAMKPKVEKAGRMREDIEIMEDVIQKRPLAIDVVAEIYSLTPKGITFNLMNYESGEALLLRGNAPSLEAVIGFIKTLEESKYFSNVKVKYTSKRDRADRGLTDFEVICILSRMR